MLYKRFNMGVGEYMTVHPGNTDGNTREMERSR